MSNGPFYGNPGGPRVRCFLVGAAEGGKAQLLDPQHPLVVLLVEAIPGGRQAVPLGWTWVRSHRPRSGVGDDEVGGGRPPEPSNPRHHATP